MADIGSEPHDKREMPRLPRRSVHGTLERPTEGLVVRPNGELPALEHVTEMLDGKINSQQLPIEGTVFHLRC